MTKKRLDLYLAEKNFCPSRESAKALIKDGKIKVNGTIQTKASFSVTDEDLVEIEGETLKYVSRGGLKLEKAINAFSLSLEGKTAIDIGASTGGFTDCMLQNGALKVYAIDVGSDQLAEKLLKDERVVNMEKTNIRNVTVSDISHEVDFASIDVAFISLKLVLPVAYNLLKNDGELVALIKPQFEAGKENIGKKGVVKGKDIHEAVVKNIVSFSEETGFNVKKLDFSPIRGPEGNIEYLMYCIKEPVQKTDLSIIKTIVEKSHAETK